MANHFLRGFNRHPSVLRYAIHHSCKKFYDTVLFTMVNFDVAAELAAVKDTGRVAEPGAGGHGHGQGSLVGQMIHNSVLEKIQLVSPCDTECRAK